VPSFSVFDLFLPIPIGAILGRDCVKKADQSIECPKNAGTSYRAGFKQTREGWRMIYFVAGD
jgi:hypothetical protein